MVHENKPTIKAEDTQKIPGNKNIKKLDDSNCVENRTCAEDRDKLWHNPLIILFLINLIFLPLQLFAYITCIFNGIEVSIRGVVFALVTYMLVQAIVFFGVLLLFKSTRTGKHHGLKTLILFQLMVVMLTVSPILKYQVMPVVNYDTEREESDLAHNYFQTSKMWSKVLLDNNAYRISYLDIDDVIHVRFKDGEEIVYIALGRSEEPVHESGFIFEKLTEEVGLYRVNNTIGVNVNGVVYSEVIRATSPVFY